MQGIVGLLDAFLESATLENLSRRSMVAGLHAISHAQFNRIYPEFTCNGVELPFVRETGLWHAESPISPRHGLVGVHAVGVDPYVGDPVRADGGDARGPRDQNLIIAVGPRIPYEPKFSGDEFTVVHDAGFDFGGHGLADEGRNELLVPRHFQPDGATVRLQRERSGQAFRESADLPAERTADVHRDDPDVALGELQPSRHVFAGKVEPLGAAPDVQFLLSVEFRDADVGLHADVLDHGDLIGPLKDAVRFAESFLDVSFADAGEVGDVCVRLLDQDMVVEMVIAQIRMDENRIGLHRLFRIKDGRKILVFHFDEFDRLLRRVLVDCGDTRDGLSYESDPVHAVDGLVRKVSAPLRIRIILPRDDGVNPSQALGLVSIDISDEGVRLGAPEDFPVEHAGKVYVRPVGGQPSRFFVSVSPLVGSAKVVEWGCFSADCLAHSGCPFKGG